MCLPCVNAALDLDEGEAAVGIRLLALPDREVGLESTARNIGILALEA
jgi:hypothetical protein